MWMPGSGFQKHARATREAVDDMMNIPFEMVKKAMVYITYFVLCGPCSFSNAASWKCHALLRVRSSGRAL